MLSFDRVGDVRVTHGGQRTDNLLVHPHCGNDVPRLAKKELPFLKVYPSEINRKIFACGEDGSTGVHLLLEERRKQVNRGEEPVTEDLVVETGYVSGEFVDHSFTKVVLCCCVSLPCVHFKLTEVAIPRVCPHPHFEASLYWL